MFDTVAMEIKKINPEQVGVYSKLYLDYLSEQTSVKDLYNYFPRKESITKILAEKSIPPAVRAVLKNSLLKQYSHLELKSGVKENIQLLEKENTYTVTTGHQLNLFTGPLYFIYKIVTTINICKQLSQQHPDKNFVPVYWMATEDHDFEEINYFNLFGKSYSWTSPYKGAVGRFKLDGMEELINSIPENFPLFKEAYTTSANLADATRKIVDELFAGSGIVVIDGDDKALKSLFAEQIRQELCNSFSYTEVNATINVFENMGYKSQVYPREINLFYLDEGLRERIIKEDGKFKVLNTNLEFTEAEILKLVEEAPEKFSPNVVLRPLYEEVILPNIAYIGGPAEVVYWLELKAMFDKAGITFPLLFPRLGGLIIKPHLKKKWEKLGFTEEDLFKEFHILKQQYLQNKEGGDGLEDFDAEKNSLEALFAALKDKAGKTDKSLEATVMAESKKALDIIAGIEKKVKKAAEKKSETELTQIANVQEKLFPGGGLQERHDNFLNFYSSDPEFIKKLYVLDPFDFRFNIIELDA